MLTKEQEIIHSILKKALLDASAVHLPHIKVLHLVKGDLFEMNEPSVLEYWNEISKGTPGEHMALCFRPAIAEVQCMACFQKYHPEAGEIRCPNCGSFGAKILSGEEFYLESIEMDNE